MSFRVLSVSTAGTRGPWEAGVMKALTNEKRTDPSDPKVLLPPRSWDILYGASAGAVNVAIMSCYPTQAEGAREALKFWVDWAKVWKRPTINCFTILSTLVHGRSYLAERDILTELVQHLPLHNVATNAQVYISVTDMDLRQCKKIPLLKLTDAEKRDADFLKRRVKFYQDVLIAAVSIPLLWKHQALENSQYADALLTDPIPMPDDPRIVKSFDVIVSPPKEQTRLPDKYTIFEAADTFVDISMNSLADFELRQIYFTFKNKARMWAPLFRDKNEFLDLTTALAQKYAREGEEYVRQFPHGIDVAPRVSPMYAPVYKY